MVLESISNESKFILNSAHHENGHGCINLVGVVAKIFTCAARTKFQAPYCPKSWTRPCIQGCGQCYHTCTSVAEYRTILCYDTVYHLLTLGDVCMLATCARMVNVINVTVKLYMSLETCITFNTQSTII